MLVMAERLGQDRHFSGIKKILNISTNSSRLDVWFACKMSLKQTQKDMV